MSTCFSSMILTTTRCSPTFQPFWARARLDTLEGRGRASTAFTWRFRQALARTPRSGSIPCRTDVMPANMEKLRGMPVTDNFRWTQCFYLPVWLSLHERQGITIEPLVGSDA